MVDDFRPELQIDGTIVIVAAIVSLIIACACCLMNSTQASGGFQTLDEERCGGFIPDPASSMSPSLQLLMNLTAPTPRAEEADENGDAEEAFPIEVATFVGRSWEPVRGRPIKARVISSNSQPPRPSRFARRGVLARSGAADKPQDDPEALPRSPLRVDADVRPDDVRYIEEQRARLEAALLVHVKSPVSPGNETIPTDPRDLCQVPATPTSAYERFRMSQMRILEHGPLSDDKWFSEDVPSAEAAPAASGTRARAPATLNLIESPSSSSLPPPEQLPPPSPEKGPSTAQEALAALTSLQGMKPEEAMQTIESIEDNALLALQLEAREAMRLEAVEAAMPAPHSPKPEAKPTTARAPKKNSATKPSKKDSSCSKSGEPETQQATKGTSKPESPPARSASPTKPPLPAARQQSPRKSPSPRPPSPKPLKTRPSSPRQSSPRRTEPRAASPRRESSPRASKKGGKKK